MEKQNKLKQKYTINAPNCYNCLYFYSQLEFNNFDFMQDVNLKCKLGNFNIVKTAYCIYHKYNKK